VASEPGDWIDREAEKKAAECRDLDQILHAYSEARDERFRDIELSETPDFIALGASNEVVGIELTRLKFPPNYMSDQRIYDHEWARDDDALLRLLGLIHQKESKLESGRWPECSRRILFIQLVDYPLSELEAFETDIPNENGFSEMWLADFTILPIYGRVVLHPITHPLGSELVMLKPELGKPYG